MNHSDSIAKLAEALAKAQGEIDAAARDSKNPYFKSSYADLASVWKVCRIPLSKHGLAVIQVPEQSGGNVTLHTILVHESGEWTHGAFTIEPMKPGPQELGSLITYLRRYCLSAFVGVAPENEDDDAEAAMAPIREDHEKKPKQPAKRQTQQQAPQTAKPAQGMEPDEFDKRVKAMEALEGWSNVKRAVAAVYSRYAINGYSGDQCNTLVALAYKTALKTTPPGAEMDDVLDAIDKCVEITPDQKKEMLDIARAKRQGNGNAV